MRNKDENFIVKQTKIRKEKIASIDHLRSEESGTLLDQQRARGGERERERERAFFTNRNRRKRFSQNERRRAGLQNVASNLLIFAWGLSYDRSKLSDDFTPFFRL